MTPLGRLLPDKEDYFSLEEDEDGDTRVVAVEQTTQPSKSDPANLPIEIVQKIFSFLMPDAFHQTAYDPPVSTQDLFSSTLVCREWYYAGVQMLWRSPKWNNLAQFHRWMRTCQAENATVAGRPGKLGMQLMRKFEVRHTPHLMSFLSAEMVSSLAGMFEGLTHLDLGGCAAMTDIAISSFITSWVFSLVRSARSQLTSLFSPLSFL
jgi:hypothetical protein